MRTFPATKRIAALLLFYMYIELDVGYLVTELDFSLLVHSWKSLVDRYIQKELTDSKIWVDIAVRHVRNKNNYINMFNRKGNCWEAVRSFLAIYIGLFHQCDLKDSYFERSECVHNNFFYAWEYFIQKYVD